MDTEDLLTKLAIQTKKSEYILIISDALIKTTNQLQRRGYAINIAKGLIGKQEIRVEDYEAYQYFRDVHFISNGIHGNWNTGDPSQKVYFDNLRIIIQQQLDKLK